MRAPTGYLHTARDVAAVLNLDNSTTGIVTVADHALLRTSQDVTMTAWVRAVSNAEAGFVCGRLYNTPNEGYGMYLDAGTNPVRIGFHGLSFGPQVTDYALPPNAFTDWHHYALTFNGSAASGSRVVSFYLDGDLIDTNTGLTDGIPHPTGIDYLVGNRTGSTLSMFGGDVWDNRVWSRVLSADEIAAVCLGRPVDVTSLVLWLPLDDASGTTARNLATSGVGNGTLGAGATWRTKNAYPGVMPFATHTVLAE